MDNTIFNEISLLLYDNIENKDKSSFEKIKKLINDHNEVLVQNEKDDFYKNDKYNTLDNIRNKYYQDYNLYIIEKKKLYDEWQSTKNKSKLQDFLNYKFEYKILPDIFTNTIFDKKFKSIPPTKNINDIDDKKVKKDDDKKVKKDDDKKVKKDDDKKVKQDDNKKVKKDDDKKVKKDDDKKVKKDDDKKINIDDKKPKKIKEDKQEKEERKAKEKLEKEERKVQEKLKKEQEKAQEKLKKEQEKAQKKLEKEQEKAQKKLDKKKKPDDKKLDDTLKKSPKNHDFDPSIYTGIPNLGNSCYINSSLQFLFHNEQFNTLILKSSNKNNLVKEYIKIYDKYISKNINSSDIKSFINELNKTITDDSMKIDPTIQSDATEFIMILLDKLNIKELEKLFNINTQTNIIFDKNLKKGDIEYKCEDVRDPKIETNFTIQIQYNNKNKIHKLYDILTNKFNGVTEEIIKKSDYIDCDNVKDHKNKMKFPFTRIDKIINFPDNMVIMNNIFDNKLNKVPYKFLIPNKWSHLSNSYTLKGIIVHIGETRNSGHYEYYSYDKNKWIIYSDSHITLHKNQNKNFTLSTHIDGDNIFNPDKSLNFLCPYLLYYIKNKEE